MNRTLATLVGIERSETIVCKAAKRILAAALVWLCNNSIRWRDRRIELLLKWTKKDTTARTSASASIYLVLIEQTHKSALRRRALAGTRKSARSSSPSARCRLPLFYFGLWPAQIAAQQQQQQQQVGRNPRRTDGASRAIGVKLAARGGKREEAIERLVRARPLAGGGKPRPR
jgi:hypothetical protein